MNPVDDFGEWRADHERAEAFLNAIEEAQRRILRELRCTIEPLLIYPILAGERPAPWPRAKQEQNHARAENALKVLTYCANARYHLYPPNENAAVATVWALYARGPSTRCGLSRIDQQARAQTSLPSCVTAGSRRPA